MDMKVTQRQAAMQIAAFTECEDGLTMIVEQSSAVLDSAKYSGSLDGVDFELFEVVQYERQEQNDYMNFSECKQLDFADYCEVQKHYFSTREEMLDMMLKFAKSENHF
jgi:hypothetical protein